MILKINFERFSNVKVKICVKHSFMEVFEKITEFLKFI